MADKQIIISEFTSVTGANEDRARFFLEAANWELHTALSAYYEDDADDESLSIIENVNSSQQLHQSTAATTELPKMSGSNKTGKDDVKSKGGRFATLSSYANDENSDEEEEGQAFYAGGSETSGQQILGPNKKKADITQALFDAAKSHGAEVVSEEPKRTSSKSGNIFKGAGFTLGSNVAPSEQIGDSLSMQPPSLQPKDVSIKFWKNGFSVDNGPLRDFKDPENKDFLNSIGRGEVPDELRKQAQGGEVHVNMEDHREEEFKKPKETLAAFSGAGHTLGSPTPHLVTENALPPIAASSSIPSQQVFKVDASKPTTTVQIRLSDGTRLVTKFNLDNNVGDIRNVVKNARPGNTNFRLMTTFPNKVLDNDEITIETAKLQNAVVVQR